MSVEKVIRFEKITYRLIWNRYFKECRKVLDAGCGPGILSNMFPDKCISVDIVKNPFWFGKNLIIGDVCNLPFKPNTFDGIFCSQVLEHIKSPEKSIKEFYRVIKQNGKLAIIVPSYLTALIPLSKYNFYKEPTHVKPFTMRFLFNLLKTCGFAINKIKYNEYYFPFLRFLFRKLSNERLYAKIVKNISFPFPPFELFAYAEKIRI